MPAKVTVCEGCCCGNVDKGHPEVPVNYLLDAWNEYDIAKHVELEISGCLGPCSKHNVSILKIYDKEIWIGELNEESHYKAIVEWASKFSSIQGGHAIPKILQDHVFDPDEDY